MSITVTRDGKAEVSNVGRTLSLTKVQVRVSSDHAFIDSGWRLRETYWDGRYVRQADYWVDDVDIRGEVDADDDTRRAADLFRRAYSAVSLTLAAYKNATEALYATSNRYFGWMTNITRGMMVEVYKGRKVPKGFYRVERVAEGNYGSYVDLEGGHRYVSVDNIRRPPVSDETLRSCTKEFSDFGGFANMVFGVLKEGSRPEAWLAVSDWLQDSGNEMAEHIRNAIHLAFNTQEYKESYRYSSHVDPVEPVSV